MKEVSLDNYVVKKKIIMVEKWSQNINQKKCPINYLNNMSIL